MACIFLARDLQINTNVSLQVLHMKYYAVYSKEEVLNVHMSLEKRDLCAI